MVKATKVRNELKEEAEKKARNALLRRHVATLLREIGVLWLAFGLLDPLLKSTENPSVPVPFSFMGIVMVVSLVLMGGGVAMDDKGPN